MALAVLPGAALQAADASQHLVLPALLDFLGHLRVCQRGPGHGDQIGLAGLQNALRHLDVVDAAHGNHRDMHRALDGGGVLHIGAPGHHRGWDDVLGGGVHPLGVVDAVGPGLFHQPGQHLGLLYLQAARDVLHGAHSELIQLEAPTQSLVGWITAGQCFLMEANGRPGAWFVLQLYAPDALSCR